MIVGVMHTKQGSEICKRKSGLYEQAKNIYSHVMMVFFNKERKEKAPKQGLSKSRHVISRRSVEL
jgi:hypothetical protein